LIYWDASALVKKYLSETGSDTVRQWLAKDPVLVTSQLAYAEIHATFARKRRERDISSLDYQRVCRIFEADWQAITVVQLDDRLLPTIRSLLSRHPLRGADSVHLASALYTAEQAQLRPLPFACADNRLLQAARKEGLDGWNPLISA